MQPGQTVDRFEIVRLLGQGGMGAVYEARDPDLARAVALKLIHEPDAHRSIRFLREAQALAQLQHPNVVAVYEVGTDGERVFIAMELVDGQSLDHTSGKRPWREVVPLFVQVGRGLAAAHAKDLVHRDVKPSNIFVGTDGRARIGDFGLARQGEARDTSGIEAPRDLERATAITVENGAESSAVDAIAPVTPGMALLGSTLTGAGAYIGTPRYMSPEQHQRRGATAKSDQFAFCVALHEMIFGEHPFELDADGGIASSVVAGKRRPAPSGAPRWLVAAIDRGLARDPDARHASMTTLCDLLEQSPVRRRRVAYAAGAATALAAAAAVGWWLVPRGAARVSCGRAGDGLATVWNPDVRARIEASFVGAGAFGADSAARTSAGLDAWGGRWREARIDACRATHERGEQSAPVLDRRMACLDRELALAGGVVARLAAGGTRVAANAPGAVESLPAPESCNAARLQATTPYPDDPRVEAIRADLAAMRAANVAGDLPEARRLARSAKATADALGHPGLRAEVLLEYAFYISGEDAKAAQAAREEALAQAVAAGDRDVEATATLRLLEAAAARADAKAVETLLPVARAAIARDGVAPGVELLFREKEAIALDRLGKYDEARAACERLAAIEPAPQPAAARCRCVVAIDAMASKAAEEPCRASLAAGEAAYGEHHPVNTARMSNLATALKAVGKMDEALALDARALAINEAAHGPESEDVAALLSSGADRLMIAGRTDEAIAGLTRAIAIRAKLDGDTPGRLQGHSEHKLAEAYARTGKLDEALVHADRAMQILEAAIPPGHPDLIKAYAQYGNINLAAERWPAVERAMGRCAELALAAYGPRHQVRAVCLLGLAQYKLAAHQAAAAAADAQVALEVMIELHLHPTNVGAAEGVLGRALGESGDKAGAREHLDKAIAIFEQLGPGGAASLAEAKRHRKRF
ncbi:MAG TPA: serine/threonine-protein kinase [Kofleriaceae bacterium]|nr:serine/threonine-protein kinase [Kofleriaceae bacterium]